MPLFSSSIRTARTARLIPTIRQRNIMTEAERKGDTIDLYSLDTPNGQKIGIALQEIGAQYKAHVIDIRRGDQFKPEFLAISPNNRIPAIVHHMTNESDGTVVDIPIFESGAILIHLAETYGRRDLLPGTDQAAKRSEVLKWLFWQVGGLGPMAGQMSHFFKFALTDEKDEEKKERRLEYGKERYLKETQRLFGVLDKQLEGKTFVTGDTLTIADMAIYPWVHSVRASHDMLQHFDQFSNVKRYTEHMGKLESVKHGMHVTPFPK